MYDRELASRQAELERDILAKVRQAAPDGIPFGILYEQLVIEHFGHVKTGAVKKGVKTLVRAEKVCRENPRTHAKLEPHELIQVPVD